MSWGCLMAIDLEAQGGGQGEQFCVLVEIASCVGVKTGCEPEHNEAGCREAGQLAAPSLSVLEPDHRPGEAGDEFGCATA
jgi:hypothetical protein